MKTVKTLSVLEADGFLPEGSTPALEAACAQLPLGVTRDLLDLIDPNDPEDPIRAQFIPTEAETHVLDLELQDPLGDEAHSPALGIVHRYPDRVLLNCVTSCAAYCRFCFRRSVVGKGATMLSPDDIQNALDYIALHREIREVILSGGDPLTMSDRRIAALVEQLNAITHVEIIRIHTRLPIVDPARVTDTLLQALKGRCPVYLLLHCNHPRELSKAVREALRRITESGVVVLSQSVLLAGVNDDVDVLEKLMRTFLLCRVVPHYIHHPDLAQGTLHFRLPLERGMALMQALRAKLSGLCQPTYILEIPGGEGKIPVNPNYISPNEDGSWRLMGPDGSVHTYRDQA